MGCFSYKCLNSGLPALSDSFSGTDVYLFLLKDGEVIEEMRGNYDSYGRVFNKEGDSFEWGMEWGDICTLNFNSNPKDGIAMIIAKYYDGNTPEFISEGDPNQGWDNPEDVFGKNYKKFQSNCDNPYHKVYKSYDMSNYIDEKEEKLKRFLDEHSEETSRLIQEAEELLKRLSKNE